ncbi:hypothetical protein D3C85_1312110 [compost metagenome]
MLCDQSVELLAHPLEEGRVLIKVNGAVLTNGVFHLARFGSRTASRMACHLLDEIGVQQFDRGNFRIYPKLNQMLVDQRGDLLANA